jgi:hypothetical protein
MTPLQFIKHKSSRLRIYYYQWLKKRPLDHRLDPETQVYQNVCFHICRKLLKQKDSEVIFAPLSQKRIIKNERLGIYLTLQNQQAFVTNHVYHYAIVLDPRTWERTIYLFNHQIESRRRQYEVSIHSQISHSLNDILKKF